GPEAVEILSNWIQDPEKSVLERSEAVKGFEELVRRDSGVVENFKAVTVPALIGGFKTCLANITEKEDEDEEFPFRDILDTLGTWTRKNFGEGRDHSEPGEMKKTIADWEKWWEEENKK
ncbi:MAG: hypothetical protein ACYTFG_13540, partial [Planctomycetota bacterium]